MNIYVVRWRRPNAGEYVPPDPCAGGDYYPDKYGNTVVTCSSKVKARAAIKALHPDAVIRSVTKLGEA